MDEWEIQLCDGCGPRLQAHTDAAASLGEELTLPLIASLLCTDCFMGAVNPVEEEELPPGPLRGIGFYL